MHNLLPNNLLSACTVHQAILAWFRTFHPVVAFSMSVAVSISTFYTTLFIFNFVKESIGDHNSLVDTYTEELGPIISEWRIDPVYIDYGEGEQKFINSYDHIRPRTHSKSSSSSSSDAFSVRASRAASPITKNNHTSRSFAPASNKNSVQPSELLAMDTPFVKGYPATHRACHKAKALYGPDWYEILAENADAFVAANLDEGDQVDEPVSHPFRSYMF